MRLPSATIHRAALAAALSFAPALAGAQISAPVLKWQRGGCTGGGCQTGWYASPAVTDLEPDGSPDVVWGAYDIVALNGATGALKWRAANGQRVWPGVAVADLTGDGPPEIIAGRGGDQLTVYNGAGGALWTVNPFGGGEVRSLVVEDLEFDGQFDIIVGRASGGSTRQINAFYPSGAVRPGWPARHDSEPGYGWGMYNQNVTVADLNMDGAREVIGPTDTHYITALNFVGAQLPVNPVYTGRSVWAEVGVHVDHLVDVRGYANCGVEHRPNFADSAPVIADVNGDGTAEIIVVGNVYNCGADPYQSLYQMPFIFKLDRTRWSGNGFDWTAIPVPGPGSAPQAEDYNVIESAVPNPVVADLDGDGFKEILFPSYDGKLHAYWLDKTEHGIWPFDVPGAGIRFAGEPAVADLDNDGRAEVLFTSWPQKAGAGVGQLHVLNYLGGQLFAIDLPASFPAGSWNGGLAAPTLANIDADADLELVAGTAHSGVVAYDLPNTANARLLWSTGRGSAKRSGVAKPDREYRSGFADVPPWNAFYPFVNTVALNSVTSGCYASPPLYCPGQGVTRGQMAVFLLRSQYGPAYVPPACTTPVFTDVPCSNIFAAWINDLVAKGVTSGCGTGTYCPDAPVTREQMAVFLLRTRLGASYNPPACTTPTFTDVPCSSPFARWIYDLVARQITAGCGAGTYCPAAFSTRAQMAVFLVKTFALR
jgi:VCBS repeat protein/S-layer family protein